jgi:hypothetical protein
MHSYDGKACTLLWPSDHEALERLIGDLERIMTDNPTLHPLMRDGLQYSTTCLKLTLIIQKTESEHIDD